MRTTPIDEAVPRRRARLAAAVLGAGLLAAGAGAQDPPAPAPQPQPTPAAAPAPKVVAVTPPAGGLGDRITVTVRGLPGVLEQAGGCEKLVLFLGGMPLEGLPPERCDPDDGHVGFLLDRDETSDRAWHALLGRPESFTRPVEVSVGSSKDRSFPTDVTQFGLVILPRLEFWTFVVLSVLVLVLLFRLGRDSELLRVPRANPGSGERRPYSLSRCQMAFWSVLVAIAYAFVWLVTGELDTITPSVLVLMGISSGTALSAGLMESSKADAAAEQSQRLSAERAAVAAALPALASQATAVPAGGAEAVQATADVAAKKLRLAQIDAQLTARAAPIKHTSRGSLLTDILSDPAGISIQRFQMLIWTVVLGLIFCASVYDSLEMPEFSNTLLALLGISSGTYLGFKTPERYKAPPPAPDGGAN